MATQSPHPAESWLHRWDWADPVLGGDSAGVHPADARALFDSHLLQVIKAGDLAAASGLRSLSLGLAAQSYNTTQGVVWKIAAACFEALSQGLVAPDLPLKRTLSRLLPLYAGVARGEDVPSADTLRSLAHELLYFCAGAEPALPADAPVLSAVRQAYGLTPDRPWQAPIEEAPPAQSFSEQARQLLTEGRMIVGELWLGHDDGAADASARQSEADNAALARLHDMFRRLQDAAGAAGLGEFGYAAAALASLAGDWCNSGRAIVPGLLDLLEQGLRELERWVDDIDAGQDLVRSAAPFNTSVQAALRQGQWLPLALPDRPGGLPWVPERDLAALDDRQLLDDAATLMPTLAPPDPTIADIDFGSLAGFSASAPPAAPAEMPQWQPTQALPSPDFEREFSREIESFEHDGPAPGADDPYRQIGPLRVPIAQFNQFLNEADEWSRRLVTALSEWAFELHRPLDEDTHEWPRLLAERGTALGLSGLSDLAQTLGLALQQTRRQTRGSAEQAAVFCEAAEELQRLLHQFAAGFLKQPDAAVLARLRPLALSAVASPPAELLAAADALRQALDALSLRLREFDLSWPDAERARQQVEAMSIDADALVRAQRLLREHMPPAPS